METQYTNHTLQEKALKLKKQRRRQILASLLGIAILAWGIVEVACLFFGLQACRNKQRCTN